jgi:predicted phosphodiesterase
MAYHRGLKGETVFQYVKDNPSMSTSALGKKLYEEQTAFFPSVSNARDNVRTYRGTRGKAQRKCMQNVLGITVALPPSDSKPWLPYIVKDDFNNTLILADLHIPYHCEMAIECAVKRAQDSKVDSVIIDGDAQDCYSLSNFCRDPRKRSFKGEIELFCQFLDYLDKKLPKAKKILKLGNHEERIEHYVYKHAPEFKGLDCLNYTSLINAVGRGLLVVADQRVIKYGKLHIIHGHEYGRAYANSPVNPARSLFTKTKECAIMGHQHQTSGHSETNIAGNSIATWSMGCLCDLHPEYSRINKWNHGFAILEKDNTGNFEVHNYRIINGEVKGA